MTKRKLFLPMFALMLCMGAFLFTTPAFAAESAETLTVEAVWLEGDTLHIQVTDRSTGADRTLELNLRDYAGTGDEYVSVQAIDRAGNKSNTIRFKNPYYTAPAPETQAAAPTPDEGGTASPSPGQSESALPDGAFTPDGAGTVMDNVTTGEGKEFFTIKSEDGAVYYLIVDRRRTSDNVYFLNAVTERDLLSIAESGDGTSESAIPGGNVNEPTMTPPGDTSPEPTPEAPAAPATPGGMGGGAVIFILLAAIAAGGAGYHFKILRPKKQAAADDFEEYDEPEEDSDDGDSADDEDDDCDGKEETE
ncbi:MAG: DUF4366 domain-containing protein [Clostridiales Family XIII bacterium]|jgi:hypothetical protein|nr:DUF4366 domain-containing protein [Clostridiales Family XIII bacterium]